MLQNKTQSGSPARVLPFIKCMSYSVPNIGRHCFKKSVNFKILTQKHDNYMMSKELFTLPVKAMEEKALGPRTEMSVGTGKDRRPGSSSSMCQGTPLAKMRDLSSLRIIPTL